MDNAGETIGQTHITKYMQQRYIIEKLTAKL